MKTHILTFGLALIIGLSGCASNPAMATKKAGFKTVSVDTHVDSKQGMRYGVDLSGGGLANMLASAIVDAGGQKGVKRMSEVMQSNNIVVSDMVRESVIARLRHNPELNLIDDNGDGTFVITIQQFGFDNPGLQIAKKVPIIVLTAELMDHKGNRLWRNQNAAIELKSKDIGATWEEYEATPEKLRADWKRQIETVVEQLFPEK